SQSQGRELASNPGFYLEPNAAKAWDRACAEFGKQVLLSGALRSIELQVKLFDGEKFPNQAPQYGRYVRGNRAGQRGYTTDVRGREADGSLYRGSWWTRKAGTAAAAVPGTSNHGSGRAVDVKTRRDKGDPAYPAAVVWNSWNDADRREFLRIAAKHGWADDEGRKVNEVWHLTYYPERDQHRGEKPKKTLIPTQEVPDMDAKQLSEAHAILMRKLPDGSGATTPDQIWARTLDVSRRTLAAVIAEQAVAKSAEVDVNADDVADALLERMSPAVAQGVVDALVTRLAK